MKTIAQSLILGFFMIFTICPWPAWAGNVTIPNTFTDGTAAVAAEVNANFSALEAEVDDNDARITANGSGIVANGLDIAANAAAIGGMPGISFLESSPPSYVTATNRVLFQQTLTAPTDGFIFAIFSGIAYFNHTPGTAQVMEIWMNTDGTTADNDGSSFRYFRIPSSWEGNTYFQNASSFRVIPVLAGDTTVYVVGDGSEADNSTTTFFYRCGLTLLFFPNNY